MVVNGVLWSDIEDPLKLIRWKFQGFQSNRVVVKNVVECNCCSLIASTWRWSFCYLTILVLNSVKIILESQEFKNLSDQLTCKHKDHFLFLFVLKVDWWCWYLQELHLWIRMCWLIVNHCSFEACLLWNVRKELEDFPLKFQFHCRKFEEILFHRLLQL